VFISGSVRYFRRPEEAPGQESKHNSFTLNKMSPMNTFKKFHLTDNITLVNNGKILISEAMMEKKTTTCENCGGPLFLKKT